MERKETKIFLKNQEKKDYEMMKLKNIPQEEDDFFFLFSLLYL